MDAVAEQVAADADQQAERQVEVPDIAHQRARGRGRDEQHHAADSMTKRGPFTVHQPADERADQRRDEEAEREHARDDAAVPAEFVEDRRKQQREGGARIDADRHGDERRRRR